jgi:hypothetical protein
MFVESTTSCFLMNFLMGVVSSLSSFDKETCFTSSLIASSLTISSMFSSSLYFLLSYQILSYIISKVVVYFLVCSKCHFLNFVLAYSKNSSIYIRNHLMNSSYNIALVLFLVATFSQSLVVCNVSNYTLPCAICNSFHNVFCFATKIFRSL